MHICVLGAGGIGCWLAARLCLAGHRVTLLARGAALAVLQRSGLTAKDGDGKVIGVAGPPLLRATASGDDATDVDALFVAVKTHQLGACYAQVAAVLRKSPRALVLPFLNGVDATQQLRAGLEAEGLGAAAGNVLGGIARCIVYVGEPGTVVLQTELNLSVGPAVGELSAEQLERLRALSGALTAARVQCSLVESAEAMQSALWSKFLLTGCIGPLTAAARAPVDVVMRLPESRALAEQLMTEMARVAQAGGVRMAESAVPDAIALVSRSAPGVTYSTTRDILGGRPSELLEFCGTVVRLGRERGVPTAAHAQLLAVLLPQERLARGELAYELHGV
jgi:2-dehydropantoate 2-reductase